MPMFKALRLCPDAVVVRPRMAHYVAVSRALRALMRALTPLVEPLSLDEAFLDLTGTERLHGAPAGRRSPACRAAFEARARRHRLGGLSHNKFLAKIASDLDKPRGFAVVGRAETDAFLADKPVSVDLGVGHAALRRAARRGHPHGRRPPRRDRAAAGPRVRRARRPALAAGARPATAA